MSHVKTYLKYKAFQLRKALKKHYEYPMFITWVWIIVGSSFVYYGMHLHAIISFGLAILYYTYCDYKTGEDVGWYRRRLKERAEQHAR